jgi:hypothetical protein
MIDVSFDLPYPSTALVSLPHLTLILFEFDLESVDIFAIIGKLFRATLGTCILERMKNF